MKKQFFASCVNWSGDIEELSEIIDSGVKISKTEFFRKCDIEPILAQTMKQFPNDYTFYKGTGKHRDIYWFTWSAIEHFYR